VTLSGAGRRSKVASLLGLSERRIKGAGQGLEMADFAAGVLSADGSWDMAGGGSADAGDPGRPAVSASGLGAERPLAHRLGGEDTTHERYKGFVVRDGVDGTGRGRPPGRGRRRGGESEGDEDGEQEAFLMPDTSYLDGKGQGGAAGCCCSVA